MLGRSHFVSGTLAFMGSTLAYRYNGMQMITGLLVVPCAALLPDADHSKATISRTYGPVTVAFSKAIAYLAGGHRKGTHSLLGIFLLGLLTEAGVAHRHTWWGAALLCAVLIPTLAAGVRIFRIRGWIDDLLPIPVTITVVAFTNIDLTAVPPALMLGCLVHVAGDCLTNSGCPIFWPFSKFRLKFGLFKTGKWVEKRVVFPLLLVGTLAMIWLKLFDSGL